MYKSILVRSLHLRQSLIFSSPDTDVLGGSFRVFLVPLRLNLCPLTTGYESGQDAGCHQEGHDQTQPGAGEDGGIRADAENL